MLAVRDTDDSAPTAPGLDAGAVAMGIARLWADAGRDVLLVDADAHGTGLPARIGAAARLALPPVRRGLPSLIAERASLNAEAVARHCWLLPAAEGSGSVHLLGAPAHPDGARRSSGWLADRCCELAALTDRWSVIVSMPGPAAPPYEPLVRAASQRLTLTVAVGVSSAGGMRAMLGAFGLRCAPDPEVRLCAVGASPNSPDSPHTDRLAVEAGAPLVGGIRRVRPAALLGARARRRDRVLLDAVAEVTEHLSTSSRCPGGPVMRPAGPNGLAARHDGQSAAATDREVPNGMPSGGRP